MARRLLAEHGLGARRCRACRVGRGGAEPEDSRRSGARPRTAHEDARGELLVVGDVAVEDLAVGDAVEDAELGDDEAAARILRTQIEARSRFRSELRRQAAARVRGNRSRPGGLEPETAPWNLPARTSRRLRRIEVGVGSGDQLAAGIMHEAEVVVLEERCRAGRAQPPPPTPPPPSPPPPPPPPCGTELVGVCAGPCRRRGTCARRNCACRRA